MMPHAHEQPATMAEEPHQHPHDDGTHRCADHDHEPAHAIMGWLRASVPFLHGHRHGEASVDRAMETSDRGVWALKVSLAGLGVTALFQLVIVLLSGSAGLFADTIHNVADAFTAVPLWIAFALARRPATRRYTYGYGRAEDIAHAMRNERRTHREQKEIKMCLVEKKEATTFSQGGTYEQYRRWIRAYPDLFRIQSLNAFVVRRSRGDDGTSSQARHSEQDQ